MSWRSLLIFVPLLAILAAAGWLAYEAWISVPGPPMPTSGYVAMWLGIVFSAVIGCGLMALVFISSRHGYDDAAHDDTHHEPK
jgi:Na+-driven multidrug efflux pump